MERAAMTDAAALTEAQAAILTRMAVGVTLTHSRLGDRLVERTLAWVSQFRRLTIRCERHAGLYRAFLVIAAAVICVRALEPEFIRCP